MELEREASLWRAAGFSALGAAVLLVAAVMRSYRGPETLNREMRWVLILSGFAFLVGTTSLSIGRVLRFAARGRHQVGEGIASWAMLVGSTSALLYLEAQLSRGHLSDWAPILLCGFLLASSLVSLGCHRITARVTLTR